MKVGCMLVYSMMVGCKLVGSMNLDCMMVGSMMMSMSNYHDHGIYSAVTWQFLLQGPFQSEIMVIEIL